jgi:predicted O-methyltransferase YrrM
MNLFSKNAKLKSFLDNLHSENEKQLIFQARNQFNGTDEEFKQLLTKYNTYNAIEKGKILEENRIKIQNEELALSVSPEMGQFLFMTAMILKPKIILELGSSIGVSTIYFAEALRQINNDGFVIATELSKEKCDNILKNAELVGLNQYVKILYGDVFETIKNINEKIDIVFIDIWASGYMEIFEATRGLLKPGAVFIADNMYSAGKETALFKEYLDKDDTVYNITLDFESGVEYGIILKNN